MRVLIVDDDPGMPGAVRRAWQQGDNGASELVLCSSPDEALAQLAAGYFDIMFTDYRMPGMCGDKLVAKALALAGRADMVCVLMSGLDAKTASRIASQQPGIFMFLNKPWSMAEFADTKRQVLIEVALRRAAAAQARMMAAAEQVEPAPQGDGADAQ